MLIRRFFAFVISAFLIFYPAYAYATTSVGGWTATDSLIAGANTTINAAKTAGGKALKSSITVAASASKVGKHLIKGGGSAALAFAMVELADGAIDWVLDPANNAVKYKDPTAVGGNDGSVAGTVYRASWRSDQTDWHSSRTAACLYSMSLLVAILPNDNWKFVGITGSTCNYTRVSGSYNLPLINKQGVPEGAGAGVGSGDGYKYIPIETVAAKVIANAEAGHAPSQEAVKATALEGFAAGEHDAALEAAATEAGTENPPDTENPPVDPAAPFDPSSIIAAINSLKAMLAGILSSMTGFFDWVQAPVPPDNEEKKDVPFATTGDVGLDSVDRFEQRVDFNGQCPSNDFSFSMLGVTYSKPIPYHYFCGFLEQIAPWLLAMCYLGTAYFVVENV